MSTYEKIASVIIAIFIVFAIIFSYHEIKEPSEGGMPPPHGSRFDESVGQKFTIGAFDTVVSEHGAGGQEDGCGSLQSVIAGVLHDISERLHAGNAFEVNDSTLQLFCNKQADITLTDASGTELLLRKVPFTRAVPPGDTDADIGTEVHIDATVVPEGASVPAQTTTYGDELIPDQFLDNDTPSRR